MHDELTEVDIRKMQEEIDYRIRELRPKLIEEVQTTRAFGDLSENYEYKTAKLAMGAYVAVTKDDTTTFSYMQDTTKGELIGNYSFASYNNVIGVE